jgi:hypothetical protein
MPTVFKQAVATEIGITPVDVLDIPGGVRATVIGCNIANVTDYDTVSVNVFVIGSDTTRSYFVKAIPIPPNTSLKVITNGEKLILPELTGLRISCDVDNSVDATVSYVEIS